jgi:hypothetical protein
LFLLKLIPVLLFCLPTIAAAGETITVHFDDLPGRETRRTARIGNALSMDIEGDPKLLEEMEEQGAKFPFTFSQRDVQTTLTRTQPENSDGSFELERTIEQWASFVRDENGKEIEIETPLGSLKGLAIRATHRPDGTLTFIDFKGGDFDDEQRAQLAVQLSQMMELFDHNAFSLSSKQMAVGDTVANEMSASIPIPGRPSADLAIVTTHTLDKIESGQAHFSTTANVTLQDSGEQTITAKGKGSGEMIYEIAQQMISRETMDMDISIEILPGAPGAKMTLEIQATTKIESTLLKAEPRVALR